MFPPRIMEYVTFSQLESAVVIDDTIINLRAIKSMTLGEHDGMKGITIVYLDQTVDVIMIEDVEELHGNY